jgi:anti-sigma factor ChrR (cupin superfamily)
MTVQSEVAVSRPIAIHEVPWEAAGPGLSAKPLWADPQTQRRAYVGRIAAGTKLPLHRHLGDELVFVIEGDVTDESGTLTAGQASYRPKGCVHSLSTERGTTVLIVVTGGMEPAESAQGEPRSLPIDISQVDWVDSAPGVRQKLIWEDVAAGRSMRFLRFEPGAELPLHRHLGDALLFGVEGESSDVLGATLPGYLSYRPDGYIHSVRSANGATMVYYAWGTTEVVDLGR